MQMDVRRVDSEKINTLYQEFKKFKPEVNWKDDRVDLIFMNKEKQKFEIRSIYITTIDDPMVHASTVCSFIPNTDNITFTGMLVYTDEIRKELSEFIKHGTSKDPIDYLIKTNN